MRMKKRRIPAPNKQQTNFYRKTYTDSLPSFDQPTTSQAASTSKGSTTTLLSPSEPILTLSSDELKDLGFSVSIDPLEQPAKKKQKTKHLEPLTSSIQNVGVSDIAQLKSAEYLGMSNEQLFNEIGIPGEEFDIFSYLEQSEHIIETHSHDEGILNFSDKEMDTLTTNDFSPDASNDNAEIEERATPSTSTAFSLLCLNSESSKSSSQESNSLEEFIAKSSPEDREGTSDIPEKPLKKKRVTQDQVMLFIKNMEEDLIYLSEFKNLVTDNELKRILYDQCLKLNKEIRKQQSKIRRLKTKAECEKRYRDKKRLMYKKALENPSDPANIIVIDNYRREMDKIKLASRYENLTPEQIEKRRARCRVANMTPEQIEKKRARNRVANMTPEQIEKKRARNRLCDMRPERIERKRKTDRDYILKQKAKYLEQ